MLFLTEGLGRSGLVPMSTSVTHRRSLFLKLEAAYWLDRGARLRLNKQSVPDVVPSSSSMSTSSDDCINILLSFNHRNG